MKVPYNLILQLLPVVLMGLTPIVTTIRDKKMIVKYAKEKLWWDISIKKVKKYKSNRSYQVSYQDLNGAWFSRICTITKTGIEWEE